MLQPPGKVFTVSVMTLRFVLAAWVGAAALFVITSVAEQTSSLIDSPTRDHLATLRFPLYYRFGFACHIAGALVGLFAWRTAPDNRRRTLFVVLALIMLSGSLLSLDYRYIYQPLHDLITPAGKSRTPEFATLHIWSRRANLVHVLVLAFAGILSTLPLKPNSPQPDEVT